MDDTLKLTIDDLLAWGLDYERLLKEPLRPGEKIEIPRPMLVQYITVANEALQQQSEQSRKKSRKKTGRPRGGGMGEMKMRLEEAGGLSPEAADRITMHAHGKTTIDPVHRAYDAARKKLGTEPSRLQKTPTSSRTARKKPPR
jgi:hypothetical protein